MTNPPNKFADGILLDQWVPKTECLQFALGGFRLANARFRSLSLAVPFNKLPKDHVIGPPLEGFPDGIDVMVVPAHPIEKDLPRIAIQPKFIRYVTAQENRYYLEFCGSFSDYLKKLSSKARRNLGRAVRKFAEFSGGEICWREFQSGQEMLEFYRLAREVTKRSYQEKLHLGLPDSDELRLAMVEEASRGLIRGYLLFHNGKPVAYSYNPIQQENVFGKWCGYDPEFRQWSPGTVLLYLMIEKLFGEKRFALFDFGHTEFEYKAFFATGYMRCARLLYFPRAYHNVALIAAHNALNGVSLSTSKLLEILRLKTAAKEILGRVGATPYSRQAPPSTRMARLESLKEDAFQESSLELIGRPE